MSMETIIARINADTAREVENIRKECQQRRAAILEDAGARAGEEYERIIAEGKRAIKVSCDRILSRAVMDMHRMVREERERVIALCFKEAEKELNFRIQTAEYPRILRNLVAEGMEDLGVDEGIIIVNERDRSLVRSLLAEDPQTSGKFSVNPECVITAGGVILQSRDGKVRVNNTIEARIERFRPGLVCDLARLLDQGV